MNRLEKLQTMLQESPNDDFLHYALGMEYVSAGQTDAALAAFQRVVQIVPAHSSAMFQQAQLLAKVGRTEEAREHAVRGVAAAEQQGDAHAAEEIGAFLTCLD